MNATLPQTAAQTPKCRKPIMLPCPFCGQDEASISVNLASLGEDGELHCGDCESDFTADSVRQIIRRWAPVLRWLDAAPAPEGDE